MAFDPELQCAFLSALCTPFLNFVAARRLAQTPDVWCLRFRRNVFFRPRAVESILPCAMPFYHRVYSPGQLQFITTSTYRRTSLFLSDRFRHCFVQRLEEVRQEWHFLLVGWVLIQQPGDARPGEFPRRLAVVKLEVLLFTGCVNSPQGSVALSSTYEKSLRDHRLPKAGVCASPLFPSGPAPSRFGAGTGRPLT